jgi:hypothetical protein
MQAITTKYLSPTNHRGARIRALTASGLAITLAVNHSFSDGRCHAEAALALCQRLGWSGELVSGCTREGYVFVFVSGDRHVVG